MIFLAKHYFPFLPILMTSVMLGSFRTTSAQGQAQPQVPVQGASAVRGNSQSFNQASEQSNHRTPDTKVYFAFQAANNKNDVFLVREESVNILYVSEKCSGCFERLGEIQKLSSLPNFIVVTASTNWNKVKKLSLKSLNFSRIYSDPGGRFVKSAGLQNAEASYLRVSNGRVISKFDFRFTSNLSNPYSLGVWK